MNVIDWMNKTAEYMVKDRPDLYTDPAIAFSDLSRVYDDLAEHDGPAWSAWGGFFVYKWVDEEGIVEWTFAKKISSVDVFIDEGESLVYGWTKHSGTLKEGVDLPSPDDTQEL